MKRLLSILLCAVLSLSVLACGNVPDETRKGGNDRQTRDSQADIKPGTKEATEPSVKPTPYDPGEPVDGPEIAVTWANWRDYIEFYQIEDNSKVTRSVKRVDYFFGVRAKEGYYLKDLSIKMNATLYYRCGNADMKEYVEKDIILTKENLTHTIYFDAEDLINYNGRIVESVYYDDVLAITGKVVKR